VLAWLLAAGAVQAQSGPRFAIQRFEVSGASALPAAQVQAALAPFTGEARDFATVQSAVAALQKLYTDAGLTAVEVSLPEQRLKDAVVRIQVRELVFGSLGVEGNRFYSEANVRRSLPALVAGQSPDVNAVARNLRAANDNPSKQTTVVFRAGEAEGSVDATARVSDQRPLRAALGLDTNGTPATGMLRSSVSLQHANVFDRDHVLSAEPPRVLRRLRSLGRWSDEEDNEVFPGSARARRSHGHGVPWPAPLAVGGDCVDCREDRVHARDAAPLGAPGRARQRAAGGSHHRRGCPGQGARARGARAA